MKKTIIFVILGILIILIGLFLYYKLYYPYSGNAPKITSSELKCGAYYGFTNQKKPGTPDNWVWESAGLSSYWHAPDASIKNITECEA